MCYHCSNETIHLNKGLVNIINMYYYIPISFFVTYASKKSINTRLKTVSIFFIEFGILNLKTDSISVIHIRPPSSIGNGNTLKSARLIESSPRKKTKLVNPFEAACAECSAIFTGPERDSFAISEFFSTKIFLSNTKIFLLLCK